MRRPGLRSVLEFTLLVSALGVILCYATCARADTPPAAPTGLTARAGPGRTISWDMGWDRASGYTYTSLTVRVWRKDAAGNMAQWLVNQTPAQMGCHLVTGPYECLDKVTFLPKRCGPEEHYRCDYQTYRDGGEPSKDYIYGIYVCDPGGCSPAPPRQPVWEADLKCINNGGSGCESDYHPVAPAPPEMPGLP